MQLKKDKTHLQDLNKALQDEWLETNGLGGWSSSSIIGCNTRRYHGLLVAAVKPPTERTLLLSKLDETIVVNENRFELGVNDYGDVISPTGNQFLKSFAKELFPQWTYEVNGVLLKKTIAMIHGENTVVIIYDVVKAAKPFNVKLVPFYKVYDEYYSVYWDYFTNDEWTARQKEYEAEKARQKEVEEKTIDNFRIGEMQPERDHNLTAGDRSYIDEAMGRPGREARAGSYFEFEMKVQPGIQNNLLLTYLGDDKDRMFDIKVDGQLIATETWPGGLTAKFYDKIYAIPQSLTDNKQKITVRIEANYRKTAGRIFGARTIK